MLHIPPKVVDTFSEYSTIKTLTVMHNYFITRLDGSATSVFFFQEELGSSVYQVTLARCLAVKPSLYTDICRF